ncbi:MAG: DUF2683 family protein [Candidatus Woesearchaeota archaeon]|nr:MAG: DUF2683 family protein [Candidatus Woesearchaeota archaeon]
MVHALVKINEITNRALNIVKAKYGLKDKGKAIDFVVMKHIEQEEPELRPEYIKKLNRLEKEKGIRFRNIEELRKIIEG